jgi:CSLREA domain-containing protein
VRGLWAGAFAVALALVAAGSAGAETFRVTQTSDANGACNDRCSLREAVIVASDQAGDDKVRLRRGRYELTIGGPGDDFGEEGDLDTSGGDVVTVAGAGMGKTVIDGNKIDRVFDVLGVGGFVVKNLTITRGKAKQGYEGAGLIVEVGGATLIRTKVSGNKSAQDSGDGAGIYVANGQSLTVKRSIVSGNVTKGGDGGGIENRGDLEVIKSTIANNRALADDGGGISMNGADSLVLDSSTVSGNEAGGPDDGGDGGGIYAPGSSTLFQIVNSTISGNAARGPSSQGGGILVTGIADLTNATVAFNTSTSDQAGGIWGQTGADVNLFNSLISGNFGESLTENCGGNPEAFDSLGHNLENLDTCQLFGPQDQFNAFPRLGPLADNGGPTRTHALRRGSDAINAGNLAGCPDLDQRGENRPHGPTCDIGAYER